MGKSLKECPITTANARSKLGTGEYARRLDADAAVWYRKGKGVVCGLPGGAIGAQERTTGRHLSVPPMTSTTSRPRVCTRFFSRDAARKIVAQARKEAKVAAEGAPLTVRSAVETYIAERDTRDSRRAGRPVRSDGGRRLRRYVVGQDKRGKQRRSQRQNWRM